jgi:hypothetical protein
MPFAARLVSPAGALACKVAVFLSGNHDAPPTLPDGIQTTGGEESSIRGTEMSEFLDAAEHFRPRMEQNEPLAFAGGGCLGDLAPVLQRRRRRPIPIRKDNKTSCCNLADCSPTTSRMIEGHYEVLVDGEWTPVPQNTIQNVTAPDGGAHVCAPKQQGARKGMIYCVVLPPES